jgi:ligand-binding SRPBCC domain-containing protein
MGFYPDMREVQRDLPKRPLHTCMFSATFPDSVLRTAQEFIRGGEFLSLSTDHVHVTDTEQSLPTHSDSVTIARPPDVVYAMVTDVTRMGELSPVCRSGAWDDPAHAGTEGAWFSGHNAIGEFTWDTRYEAVATEPGREFSFINHGSSGDVELVRWSSTFEPEGDGTKTTESWQVLGAYPDFVSAGDPNLDIAMRIEGMARMARDGIKETLAKLKRVAES